MFKKILLTLLLATSPAYAEVVEILVQHTETTYSSGSGTVIKNFVLTNEHVIEDGEKVFILYKGEKRVFEVVYTNKKNDLAILAGDTKGMKSYGLVDKILGRAKAIGYMDGQKHYTEGEYATLGSDSILYTGSVYRGQSGGPLIDEETKNVVGIISMAVFGSESCLPYGAIIVPTVKIHKALETINKGL